MQDAIEEYGAKQRQKNSSGHHVGPVYALCICTVIHFAEPRECPSADLFNTRNQMLSVQRLSHTNMPHLFVRSSHIAVMSRPDIAFHLRLSPSFSVIHPWLVATQLNNLYNTLWLLVSSECILVASYKYLRDWANTLLISTATGFVAYSDSSCRNKCFTLFLCSQWSC